MSYKYYSHNQSSARNTLTYPRFICKGAQNSHQNVWNAKCQNLFMVFTVAFILKRSLLRKLHMKVKVKKKRTKMNITKRVLSHICLRLWLEKVTQNSKLHTNKMHKNIFSIFWKSSKDLKSKLQERTLWKSLSLSLKQEFNAKTAME